VVIALKGPASAEAQELYGAAYGLAQQMPDHPSQFPLSWGWWRVARDIGVKRHRAGTLLERAVARDDPELLVQAHHCNWATHFETGDFVRCRQHIDTGLGVYRKGDFRHHARLYGNHDALVCGLGALAQMEWMQGRPVRGLAQEREAQLWAKALDHVGTHVHALDVRLLHRAQRRDHDEVFHLADDLVRFSSEHGLTEHRATGLIFRGWAVAMRGDPAAGLRMLEEGLAHQRAIGTIEDFPIYICMHGEALARARQPERAVEVLAGERRLFDQAGLLFWMPEVLRLLAEVMVQADPASVAPARALLGEAASLAEAQGVAMLGLRIALTAAKLAPDAQAAARDVASALAGIAEDDGSAELGAARDLVAAWQRRTPVLSGVGRAPP
jgi:predicted ATPase